MRRTKSHAQLCDCFDSYVSGLGFYCSLFLFFFLVDARIRDRFFGEFLNLSLYEDMAPWNIVLNGRTLAYIDYDTRERTFDGDMSKVRRGSYTFAEV